MVLRPSRQIGFGTRRLEPDFDALHRASAQSDLFCLLWPWIQSGTMLTACLCILCGKTGALHRQLVPHKQPSRL